MCWKPWTSRFLWNLWSYRNGHSLLLEDRSPSLCEEQPDASTGQVSYKKFLTFSAAASFFSSYHQTNNESQISVWPHWEAVESAKKTGISPRSCRAWPMCTGQGLGEHAQEWIDLPQTHWIKTSGVRAWKLALYSTSWWLRHTALWGATALM